MTATALPQEVLEELQALRQQRLDDLGRRPLAWLALVPAWTERLAVACSFPTSAETPPQGSQTTEAELEAFLRAAVSSNVCVRGGPPAAGGLNAWHQARALAGLVPRLPPELRARSLARARAFADPQCRIAVLTAALRDRSLSEKIAEAELLVQDVRQLPPRERTEALAHVLPVLSDDLRRPLLGEALAAVRRIADDLDRARLLAVLGPHLGSELLEDAVAAARAIEADGPRAGALGALAAIHAEPARAQLERGALDAAARIEPPAARARELVALIPVLTGQARDEALEATVRAEEAAGPMPEAADDLIELIPLLSGQRLARAVSLAMNSARTIESVGERARALAELLPHLTGQAKADLTREAIAAAEALFDPVERVGAFAAIAQGGNTPESRGRVREERGLIQNQVSAARATLCLSALFPDLRRDAVPAIELLPDDREKVHAVLQLAALGVSPAELLPAARRLADEAARADALIGLAPHLASTDLAAALDAVLKIDASRTFWMPDGIRAEILDDLRQPTSGSPRERAREGPNGWISLWREARALGNMLSRRHQEGEPLPAAVARWAELAGGLPPTPGPAGRRLIEQVRLRTEAGETGEARAWLQAGKLLAEALQGDLAAAVKAGEHALELAAWRAQDLRQLRHFLERKEQIDEFERLVKSRRGESWALHYLGLGGVGKTTLIRYATARLAPQMKIATARVDFDYLSPNYPGRRPGELLLELADKLCWAGPASQWETLLYDLRVKVDELHAELDRISDPADPIRHLEHPLFGRALDTFTSLLGSLGRMSVLILDTCEELTKLRPVGARLPNLEVTREILRRVHRALPDHVRVVFAGRRLLAQAGDGWYVDPQTGPPGLTYLPARIEYLRLHLIRGFDNGEADDYFSRVERVPLSGPMREAVLMRSREAELAPVVSWQPPRQNDDRPRYNPYDLKLYVDWLREEPDLPVDTVASGATDPYVHVRIVERLKQHPDLQAALPAAILLQRFDLEMIKAALPTGEEERLFRELGDQEWIDYRVGDGRSPTFLEISVHLHPRLLAYYQPRSPAKALDDNHRNRIKTFAEFRARLAPALAGLVRETKLGELSAIRVDAALRVMDHERAAVLWNQLAVRIPDEADWGWAWNLTTSLLGDDGAIRRVENPQDDHPLLAGVLALHVASLIHVQPDLDVSGRWTEVLDAVPRYPGEETRIWLASRARLGVIAALARSGRLDAGQVGQLPDILEEFQPPGFDLERRDDRTSQLLASVCAALEAIIERVESGGNRDLLPDPERVERCVRDAVKSEPRDAGLRAFAVILIERLNAFHGRTAFTWGTFLNVWGNHGVSEPLHAQPWFDWRAPASLVDRILLELIRGIKPKRSGGSFLENIPLLNIEQIASERVASRLDRIDSERLCSALTELHLERGLVRADSLEAFASADHYDPARQPVCAAHHAVPPLFVTLARGFLALGRGDRALQVIRNREDAARSQRDELTLELARSAQLRTLCRLRLPEARSSLEEYLSAPKSVADALDIWPMKALCFDSRSFGPRDEWYEREQTGWDRPTKIHLGWRSQAGFDFATAAALADQVREVDIQIQSAIAGLVRFAQGLDSLIQFAIDRGEVYAAHALFLDGAEASLILMRARELASAWSRVQNALESTAWYPRFVDLKDLRYLFQADSTRLRPEESARLMLRAWALREPLGEAMGQPTPGKWAGAIPERRQAEMAVEEGELLALRVPWRAVLMLDFAHGLFAKDFDHFGAWSSALLGASAAIRSGDRAGAQRRLSTAVRPHYNEWRDRAVAEGWGAELPVWSELSGWGGVPEPRWNDNAAGPLRGWLDRLANCVTWSDDPTRTGYPSHAIRARLVRQYGNPLPRELALTPTRTLWTDRAKEMVGNLARDPRRLIPPVTLLVILALLVLGLTGRISGVNATVTLVIVAGLIPLETLWNWLRVRASPREVLIRLAPRFHTRGQALHAISVQLMIERAGKEAAVVEASWTTPMALPYREAARELPERLPKLLFRRQWYSRAIRQRLCIRLVIPSGWGTAIDIFAWEAYLLEAMRRRELDTTTSWPRRALHSVLRAIDYRVFGLTEFDRAQIYRGAELQTEELPTPLWSGGRVHAVCGEGWAHGLGQRNLDEAWRKSHSDVTWSHKLTLGEGPERIKILHMIGQTTWSGSRWEFLLTGGAQGTNPAQANIVPAERLVVRRVSLVVLQLEPAESPYRWQSDRERVGELRSFAARVFAEGVYAVMVLPQMALPLSVEVVSTLAWALPETLREPPALQQLLNAASAVRKAIVSKPIATSEGQPGVLPAGAAVGWEAQRELALDICLFARGPAPRPR